MLARTFGCARVVFNDALRTRDAAHQTGQKISDTEVQRQVITLAKTTPEREWLGEVASVALVQACQDARRAYRNWFDSMSGKRKGRKVGHPRFRSRKDQPASDSADSQRIRRHRERRPDSEGRERPSRMVTGPAVGSVVGDRHPGSGRPVLRVVRGRGPGHTAPGEHQRCRC